MDELNLKEFEDISIPNRDMFNEIFRKNPTDLCAYNFVTMYCWKKIYKPLWKIFKNRLLIYYAGIDFILMPLGEHFNSNVIAEISDKFIGQGKSGNFLLVGPEYIKQNRDIEDYFNIEVDERSADYIYCTKKLCELKGKKLHKKKNLISQFLRNNKIYTVRKLEKKFFEECCFLVEKWCQDRDCSDPIYSHEILAIRRALNNFSDLELDGLIIFVQDKITAFSVFGRQNAEMADMYFEKYDRENKGAEAVICWETAKYLLDKYAYINREEDMGIEGLRQAKRSYDPEKILLTYKLYRKLD